MILQKLILNNFRNYVDCEVDIGETKTIFLIGKNGQGKTNFLEALYYISYGASFNTKREEAVVNHTSNCYRIQANLVSDTQCSDGINTKIEISYKKPQKKISINNTVIKNRAEMLRIFPSVIFKHSDIFYISGGSEYFRQYLDQNLSINFQEYLITLRKYKKILFQKNAALKQELTSMLEVYNEQLISLGLTLVRYRYNFIQYINQNLPKFFQKIFSEQNQIKIIYKPSWNIAEEIEEQEEETLTHKIKEKLTQLIPKELLMKHSLSGPQRDIIKLYLDDAEMKHAGSTGQIRTLSLILRFIQANYYYENHKEPMIYLFDDVLLELDMEKQIRFLQYLPKNNQSFFTFLPGEELSHKIESTKKKFFIVEQGNIFEHGEHSQI